MFDFDDEALATEEFLGPPFLVFWYSGGLKKDDALPLLNPLLQALEAAGIRDHLILDHFNEYGMTGEGYESFPSYVDRLVLEINKVALGRLLILFGHSRGCCPAAAVATRLGNRVMKVYFVGSQGSIVPGRPTPWERLTKRFKMCGDPSMLHFFAEMQPGNLLLQQASRADREELEELKADSKFLSNMIDLMKTQYVNCMHPDMKSGVIDVFPADICAISPKEDESCTPESLEGYEKLTSGRFSVLSVEGGHMSCLKPPDGSSTCDLHNKVLKDLLTLYKSSPLSAWNRQLRKLEQEAIFHRLPEKAGSGDIMKTLEAAMGWVARNPWATEEGVHAERSRIQDLVDVPI